MAAKIAFTADDAKVSKTLVNMDQQIARLNMRVKELSSSGKQSGEGIGKAFEGAALRLAASVVSVGALKQMFEGVEAAGERAAQRIDGIVGSLKDMVQISRDPAEFKASRKTVDDLRTQFGFTEKNALDFHTKLANQGMGSADIRSAARLNLIDKDPAAYAEAVNKIRRQFGEDVLGGSFESGAGAVGTASLKAGVTGARLGNLALSPLALGKEMGFAPEDVLAAVAVGTLASPTPEEARTQISGLFTALRKDKEERFEGLSLPAVLDRLSTMSDDDRKVLFTEKEALLGAGLLVSGREDIGASAAAIRASLTTAGTESSFMGQRERLASTDPELFADLELNRATARREIAERGMGVGEKTFDVIAEGARARMAETGVGVFQRYATEGMMGLLDTFGASPETSAGVIGSMLGKRQLTRDGMSPHTGPQIAEELFNSVGSQVELGLTGQRENDAAAREMVKAAAAISEAAKVFSEAARGMQDPGRIPATVDK